MLTVHAPPFGRVVFAEPSRPCNPARSLLFRVQDREGSKTLLPSAAAPRTIRPGPFRAGQLASNRDTQPFHSHWSDIATSCLLPHIMWLASSRLGVRTAAPAFRPEIQTPACYALRLLAPALPRLAFLAKQHQDWWLECTPFFDVRRQRTTSATDGREH